MEKQLKLNLPKSKTLPLSLCTHNLIIHFIIYCFLIISLFHSDGEDDRVSHQECGAEGVDGMEIHCFSGNLTQIRQTNASGDLETL